MTEKRRRRHTLPLLALFASFCAGVLVDGWLRTYGPPMPSRILDRGADRATERTPDHPADRAADSGGQPRTTATSGATSGARSPETLRLPLDGISVEALKSGFAEVRGDHPHEAVDIPVPRGTPVYAVTDGTIAKLFSSQAGGTTIYHFDADGRRCYYYAHLDRYAEGLHEGQHVSRGDVIGYVGTSGNAAPETPHLHFAVFALNADRKWWQGRPLDPYRVFKGED